MVYKPVALPLLFGLLILAVFYLFNPSFFRAIREIVFVISASFAIAYFVSIITQKNQRQAVQAG